jgi:hypothetical protein
MQPNFDLDRIQIASPCSMKWENMKGDERTRLCADCNLSVHNVEGMSRSEVAALLERAVDGERVCMRVVRRSDGTLLTRDCPVGKKIADRVKLRVASAALFFTGLFWLSLGRAENSPLMGEMEPMNPPIPTRQVGFGKIATPQPLPSPTPPEAKGHVVDEAPYIFEPETSD